MKMTAREKSALFKEKSKPKNVRQPDPNSWRSLGKEHGMNYGTLRNRMQRGMSLEGAVSKPILTRVECGRQGRSNYRSSRDEESPLA